MQVRAGFLLILYFFCCNFSIAQQDTQIDKLTQALAKASSDTAQITILLKLARSHVNIDIETARGYAEKATQLSEKNNFSRDQVFFIRGKIEETAGELKEAMTYYLKALVLAERLAHKESEVAEILDRIGALYLLQQNFNQSIKYRLKAIEVSKSIHDTEGISISTFNLGNVYYYMKDEKRALSQYLQALPNFERLKFTSYIDAAYNNIGAIYFNQRAYEKALEYFKKSYTSRLSGGNITDIASSLNNIGETFQKLGKIDSALKYALRGYKMADSLGAYEVLIPVSQNLALIYEEKKDFQEATGYHKIYEALKDSIFNTESQRQLQEMSVKYETEKKEKDNQLLNQQLEIKQIEGKQQQLYLIISGVVLIMIGIVALILLRQNKQKRIANIQLSEKNHIIEEQHKDITDSIRYAQRIQQAILPPDKLWYELLPNSFVLYKPKDILSGDFYWVEKKEDHIYIAAADCTGHGVPGALMSVVNFNLLNKAVLEQHLASPRQILDAVNQWLTISLHQTYNDSAVRDGMDIALCAINQKTKQLQFAGAYNGAYIFRKDGSFAELNGDKLPVGAFIEDQMRLFSASEMQLHAGDRIYVFSDGYADQFGGPKGKKLKYTQLKQYLQESLSLTMDQQKEYLNKKFEEWRGNREQVDDVLIIGIEIA